MAKEVTFVCQDISNSSHIYESEGVLLDDGRVFVRDEGTDGRDALWPSTDDYVPCGGDIVLDVEVGAECDAPTLEQLWHADYDNRRWESRTLLTSEELSRCYLDSDGDLCVADSAASAAEKVYGSRRGVSMYQLQPDMKWVAEHLGNKVVKRTIPYVDLPFRI